MPFFAALLPSIIGAGASLIGSSNSANAANSAASAQEAANQAAIAEQQREFNINTANQQPFINAGQQAVAAQSALLGLGGGSGTPDYAAYVQNNPDLLAAYQQDQASGNPSSWGSTMAQWGQSHWNQYGQNENRTTTPYNSGTGVGPQSSAQQQQSAINQLQQSPYYQSLYHNGEQAILSNGAATGGLRGGNIQNSLANFGAETLSQTIQQQLANLGGLAGQGTGAASNLGAQNSGTATQIGNLNVSNGQAQSGGILAGANANNSIINSLSSLIGKSLAGIGGTPASSGTPVFVGGAGSQYGF